jgi:hypothetical protein
MSQPIDFQTFDDGRFRGVLPGDNQGVEAVLASTNGHRQNAAHGPQAAVERQLAGQERLAARSHDAHRAQNRSRHGQVEAGSFLAHVGRREVDRDRLGRVAKAAVG